MRLNRRPLPLLLLDQGRGGGGKDKATRLSPVDTETTRSQLELKSSGLQPTSLSLCGHLVAALRYCSRFLETGPHHVFDPQTADDQSVKTREGRAYKVSEASNAG